MIFSPVRGDTMWSLQWVLLLWNFRNLDKRSGEHIGVFFKKWRENYKNNTRSGTISYFNTRFFYIKNTFYKQHDAEITKNQAKAKQHSEAELLLFENCSFLHSCYHPKLIWNILKNMQKARRLSVLIRLYD